MRSYFTDTNGKAGVPWTGELLSSAVVFMVALPLCIAIAQASGMPAEAGVITGVVGGILVGLISGSPLQVSGPAAGLIVVVADIIKEVGIPGLGVALFLAGCLQVLAGWAKLGQWFRAVSPAVIHGMLAGIGLVILAKQVHILIDDFPGDVPVIENLLSFPRAVYKVFSDDDGLHPHHHTAAGVGLLAIAILLTWKRMAPGRLKFIPAALVAVVVATVVAQVFDRDVKTVDVQNNLLGAVSWLPAASTQLFLNPRVWQAALTIAIIASAETLLCASAVDRMHTGPRTRFNRELSAQGLGNMVCGFLGALPMTGVIVRSAANVEAGAKTRWSSIFHGVWLLVFVGLFPSLLKYVPLTSLAAILIVTGFKLIDLRGTYALWRTSRSEALILIITAGTIVATDLLIGVATGVVLAVFKLAWTFSHLRVRIIPEPEVGRTVLRLDGAATFIRLPLLADTLAEVPGDTELHVDFTRLTYVDHACLQLLMSWEKQHEAAGGTLVLDWDTLHARFRSPVTSRKSSPSLTH